MLDVQITAKAEETPEMKLHRERFYHVNRAKSHFNESVLLATPKTKTHYSALQHFHDVHMHTAPHHTVSPRVQASERKKADNDVQKFHLSLSHSFPLTGHEHHDRAANEAIARGHLDQGRRHAHMGKVRLTEID